MFELHPSLQKKSYVCDLGFSTVLFEDKNEVEVLNGEKLYKPSIDKIIHMFYKYEYKDEVENHFKYEEEVVFPYIKSLCNNTLTPNFSIHEFESNHSNIEDKLNDLMNILIKYLPANIFPKERIEISLDIMEVTSDLSCHTLVEERVLVPFVEMMEG